MDLIEMTESFFMCSKAERISFQTAFGIVESCYIKVT